LSSPICLIGFGEVGQVLAADLRAAGQEQIAAFDLQFADPASAPSRALNDAGVQAGARLPMRSPIRGWSSAP
jgi:prephenate dehydrogenase